MATQRFYYIEPEEFDIMLGEAEMLRGTSSSEAVEFGYRLIEYAEQAGVPDVLVIAYAEMADIMRVAARPDEARSYLERAARIAEEKGAQVGRAVLAWRAGALALYFSDYAAAREKFTESMVLAHEHGLPKVAACSCYGYGHTALGVGDLLGALEAALDALAILQELEPEGLLVVYVHLLAGRSFERCELSEHAMRHYQIAAPIAEKLGETMARALVLLEIGALNRVERRWEEAHRYFNEAERLASAIDAPWFMVGIYQHRAYILTQQRRYAEARQWLLKAVEINESIGRSVDSVQNLLMLAEVEEREGNPAEALPYVRRVLAHYEGSSNLRGEILAVVVAVRCLKALGKFEEAGAMLERQMQLHRQLSSCASPDLLLRRVDRDQSNRQAVELEHLRMQREMLEYQTRQRMHEISATALRLRQREELIAALERKISEGIEQGGSATPLLHELHAMVANGAAESWTDFTRQVDEVHHEFVRVLAARTPTLTPTELKVCCLLRVNLSTKEIARLLGVTPKSVELYRSRIRRKLAIDPAIHLPSALLAL